MKKLLFHPVVVFLFLLIIFLTLCACEKTENALDPATLKTWEIYNTKNGLTDNAVWSLFEDADGNIWAGTLNNGVSKFDGKVWISYNTDDGLIDNTVLSIAQDSEGNMWFGTAGGLSVLSDNEWTNIPTISGYALQIFSLLKDSENNMWLGTSYLGLIKYVNEQWFQYFDNNCDDCNKINVIFEDGDHTIWYGSDADLKKLSGETPKSYNVGDGIPTGTIQSIHQDIWGNLWVGSFGGEFVAKYSHARFQPVILSNGMPQNYTTSITSDDKGNVWFGLINEGVVKYDGSVMRSVYEADGLPDNTILCILKDKSGNLWFGTSEGGLAKYIPSLE